MYKVDVRSVGLDACTNRPVLLLTSEKKAGVLPIWIGMQEAKAIDIALRKQKVPRPITHDLMKNILQEIRASVEKVVINDLWDGTYYARLIISEGDSRFSLDSRPSDAIALAVRTSAPIYVAEGVAEEAFVSLREGNEKSARERERERFRQFLENVRPEDFGDPDEIEE